MEERVTEAITRYFDREGREISETEYRRINDRAMETDDLTEGANDVSTGEKEPDSNC